MQEVAPSKGIAWPQVGSLIALNASLIISWIAYHNYQPKILEQFDYVHYSSFLGWVKLVVLAVVPPLAGYFADHLRIRHVHQIPLLSAGVSLTAMIFFFVGLVITPSPVLPWSAILPILIVLWLISMNVFYAPALASLERMVNKENIGLVVAVYALVADILYGLEPLIVKIILFVGAAPTFFLGGILIFVSGWYFQRNYRQADLIVHPEKKSTGFGHVLLIGLCVGLISGFIINRLPVLLPQDWVVANIKLGKDLWVSLIFILAAMLALPAARWAKYRNQTRIFSLSFLGALTSLVLISFLDFLWALPATLFLSVCLSLMSVTALPLAIGRLNSNRMALGMGIFLSGLELPDSLLEMLY